MMFYISVILCYVLLILNFFVDTVLPCIVLYCIVLYCLRGE